MMFRSSSNSYRLDFHRNWMKIGNKSKNRQVGFAEFLLTLQYILAVNTVCNTFKP